MPGTAVRGYIVRRPFAYKGKDGVRHELETGEPVPRDVLKDLKLKLNLVSGKYIYDPADLATLKVPPHRALRMQAAGEE